MIEILSSGLLNTIQDQGRTGLLSRGVSGSGAMDRQALAIANFMVGNAAGEAGIEVTQFPFRLRVHGDGAIAVTGADCIFNVDDQVFPSWWALPVSAGQVLRIETPQHGARAYVAFAGGLDVPNVMGSRSTDVKAAYGGLEGRGLIRGDRLKLLKPSGNFFLPRGGIGAALEERRNLLSGAEQPIDIRVIAGAEFDAFEPQAQEQFTASEWDVSNEANRMGYRLSGPELRLKAPLELFSHGILPGTVQVPPQGRPIIQLAEANTCGGYPKIAAVIEPDFWRLSQATSGAKLRFKIVTLQQAVAALARQRHDTEALRSSVVMNGLQRT